MNLASVFSSRRFYAPPLLALSSFAFGAAMAAPLYSVLPGAGELTPWLRVLKPDAMTRISQSLLDGILMLFGDGDWVFACILGMFCLVFPLLKFVVVWSSVLQAGVESSFWGRLIASAAKYAMAEFFVLVVLMLVVKGLPGGSTMRIEPAAWFFLASVILSSLALEIVRPKKS